MWKDVAYEPDFYMSEALRKGYGLHNIEAFKGFDPEVRRPRATPQHH